MTHSDLSKHPALAQAVKKLEQLNPDQFELFLQHRISTKIDSKNQRTDSLSRSEDLGIAVRLVKDQRLGFSYTTSLEKDAVLRAMDAAFEIATVMPEDPFVGLISLSNSHYPHIDNFDTQGLATPMNLKIDLAKKLETHCREADSRVTTVRSATLAETVSKTTLVDSNGECVEHQSTLYSASVSCKAEEAGDSQMGSEFGFSNFLDGLNWAWIGKSAAQQATELLQAGSAPTLQCPAVLRNSVVADLVDFLSSSFSAEQVDKGRSMLAGKQGQMIFAEGITLMDDGLLAGGYGTSPFDAEGVPSRKTLLVDGGFVCGMLYDGYYARKFGKEPTGSSHRNVKSPPAIAFANLYLQGGRKTHEQLYTGISKGILITDLMGVHTANPITGDFSLGASGILIENGQLTRPVRGFAVAGNILEIFKRVTDVANDLRFFGGIGAPSVRISEISVGGA